MTYAEDWFCSALTNLELQSSERSGSTIEIVRAIPENEWTPRDEVLEDVRLVMVEWDYLEPSHLDEYVLNDADLIVNVQYGGHVSGAVRLVGQSYGVGVYTAAHAMGALRHAGVGELANYESSWRSYVRSRLQRHKAVSGVTDECEGVHWVTRTGRRSDLRVAPANEYILSQAHVLAQLERHPGIDAILNISTWNHISSEAVRVGEETGVAVVDHEGFSEWLSA